MIISNFLGNRWITNSNETTLRAPLLSPSSDSGSVDRVDLLSKTEMCSLKKRGVLRALLVQNNQNADAYTDCEGRTTAKHNENTDNRENNEIREKGDASI